MSFNRMRQICSVARELDISSTQVLVLLLAAHHENSEDGRCFAANETIALEGHMNEKTVRRAFHGLEEKNLISTKSFGRGRLITFHLPPRPKVTGFEAIDVGTQSPPSGTLRPSVQKPLGQKVHRHRTLCPSTPDSVSATGPQSPANKELNKEEEQGTYQGRTDQVRAGQSIHSNLSSETKDEECGAEREGVKEEESMTPPKHPVAMKFLDLIGLSPKLERKGPQWDRIAMELEKKYPKVDLIALLEWIWGDKDAFWREQFAGRRSDPFKHFANSFESVLDQFLRRTKSTIKKGSQNEAPTPILQQFR
jgi:hypothetical protein